MQFLSFYSIVPAIWILELKTNRREMLCLYIEVVQSTFGSKQEQSEEDLVKSTMIMDIMQARQTP